MSTKDFLLPDLGEGLTEGEVVSWLVAVGDVVEVDQYIAEIETAKAVVEVPSPFAGTITTLHAEPGEEVMVGAPLITIDIGGDDGPVETPTPAQAAVEVGEGPAESAVDAAADNAEEAEEEGSGSVLVGYGTSGGGGSRRRRAGSGAGGGAAGSGGAGASAAGTGGPNGTPSGVPGLSEEGSRETRAAAGEVGSAPQPVEREGKPLAKPPVRKMAKDLGVDLAYVAGTGPNGIITRADIRAFVDAQVGDAGGPPEVGSERGTFTHEGSSPTRVATPAAADAPADAPVQGQGKGYVPEAVSIPAAPEGGMAQQRVPLNQMRKAISAQMGRSRREIPEAVAWVEVDATPLWEFRQQLNAAQADRPDGVKVSALAIIMRMTVAALRTFPTVNASLDTTTNEMVLHRHVNLGFAAQTDRGLVVPVIKNAHEMSILDLAEALNALAETARAGKLQPSDMSGGTFTVSNYGAFGVDGGDMVINHPEAAILGTGRITDKPWVVDGELAVRKVITYSIAFDHRIIDGGEGAGFIRHLADMTENPTMLTAAL